jgi:hypothetical protein
MLYFLFPLDLDGHDHQVPHCFLLASFAHFQHDAACRVIARLKKERDESRTLLAQAERQIPISAAGPAPVAVTNGKRGFHHSKMSKANLFLPVLL